MKSYLLVTGVLSLGLLTTVSAPVSAHHGNAAYADDITEFKQATVTKFAWANPHTLISFDATDDTGKVVHMVVETAAPQALRLIGWAKTSVEPGDVITVRMYVAKNGNPARRPQLTRPPGQQIGFFHSGGLATIPAAGGGP